MRTEVRVALQVDQSVKSRGPGPRQALEKAIKGLAAEQGDIKALEGKLGGWNRLRVSSYRVLYKETAESGVRIIKLRLCRPSKRGVRIIPTVAD